MRRMDLFMGSVFALKAMIRLRKGLWKDKQVWEQSC
jgi:hypothetical protein